MATTQAKQEIESPALGVVLPKLQRTEQDSRPVALMTCGIAGAGKTTLSKSVLRKAPHFTRLSADDYVYQTHGLYKIDYPEEKRDEYLDDAQVAIQKDLGRLLGEGKDIILDLAFWNKPYREEYKKLVEDAGGRWVLVFLDADKDVLWRRVQERRAKRDIEGRDGDCAYDVEEDIFQMYLGAFERPEGEGEVRVVIT